MSLRLAVICNEFPYPVIHGGRADVWRRLQAFRREGVSIHLIAWYVERHGAPTEADLGEVRKVVDSLDVIPVSLGVAALTRRLLYLPFIPPHASSRIPARNRMQAVLRNLERFHPDVVWLDGLYGAIVARKIANLRQIPLVFRSHNVEHQYMKRQAAVASTLRRRVALRLAAFGLRRFETGVLKGSRRVFDISTDDIRFWNSQGIAHSTWLPPTVEVPEGAPEDGNELDILFLGNLNTPNNVEAVRWLLERVVPIVREQRADTRVCIAGSRPSAEVLCLCRSIEGVELIADPISPWPLYRRARVLVNPAQTGSGVQIKTVEMLHVPTTVVSTSVGAQGLSASVRELVSLADSPQQFAAAILGGLSGAAIDQTLRRRALTIFSPSAIASVVTDMQLLAASR